MSKLSFTDKIILGSTAVVAGTGFLILSEAKRTNKIADQVRNSSSACDVALCNINNAIDRAYRATAEGNHMLRQIVGRTADDLK